MDQYIEQDSYPRHIAVYGERHFKCGFTTCEYSGRYYLDYFIHVSEQHYCTRCSLYCSQIAQHNCPRVQQGKGESNAFFKSISKTHGSTLQEFQHVFECRTSDLSGVFKVSEDHFIDLIQSILDSKDSIIIKVALTNILSREVKYKSGFTYRRYTRIYFPASAMDVFSIQDARDVLIQSASQIMNDVRAFLKLASGWRLEYCESMQVQSSTLQLFKTAKVGSYLKFPLPGRKGYFNFNVKSDCVKWSIIAGAFYLDALEGNLRLPVKERKRLRECSTWKAYEDRLNLGMFNSSVDLYESLSAFESKNLININLFSHRLDREIILKKGHHKFDRTVNLFLIHNSTDPKLATKQHMSVIYDIDKFFARTTTSKVKSHICQLCLRRLTTAKTLAAHMELCKNNKKAKQKLPEPGKMLNFTSWYMRLQYVYLCTYSVQYYSVPVNIPGSKLKYERIPASYSICVYQNSVKGVQLLYTHYADKGDIVKQFWDSIGDISQDLLTRVRTTKFKINMSPQDKIRHEMATHCDICSREFTTQAHPSDGPPPAKRQKRIIKAADHDNTNADSPNYRYSVCLGCNNQLRFKHEVVFINFNSSPADDHFLLKGLADPRLKSKDVQILAKSEHDLLEVKVILRHKIIPPIKLSSERECKLKCGSRYPRARFINAGNFLNPDRQTVFKNLCAENDPCLTLLDQAASCLFPCSNTPVADIFKLKWFPHRSLSSSHDLDKPIPGRDQFYDDMDEQQCTETEYMEIRSLCDRLGIRTMENLLMVYSYAQTLATAVCWASFSRKAFNAYKLEVATCPTVSTFAFQAMLFMTKAEMEIISDPRIQDLIADIRSGLIATNKTVVFSNHEGLPTGFDSSKPKAFLFKADCNALFPYVMSNFGLPLKNYQYLSAKQLSRIDFTDPDLEAKINGGLIVSVDLKYPPAAQENSLQLPLAIEKKQIHIHELSEHQRESVLSLQTKPLSNKRLVLNHMDKENYTCDSRILRYYLSHGLEIKKLNGGFRFDTSSDIFKKFMELNFRLRREATTESEKSLYKLMSNSIWGTCGKSTRNHMKVSICKSEPAALKHISSPRYAGFCHIAENTSLIFKHMQNVVINKPRAVAFCVSDLSKLIMYEILLDLMPKIFPSHELINLDTDGWTGLITGESEEDVWKKFYDHRDHFDFSPLSPNFGFLQKYPQLVGYNQGNPGKIKLESLCITSIVSPRPKCSSVEYYDENGVISSDVKCAGAKKIALQENTHQQYIDSVLNGSECHVSQNCIQVKDNKVFLVTSKKNIFNSLNVYRVFPTEDVNLSYPIGYHKLGKYGIVCNK